MRVAVVMNAGARGISANDAEPQRQRILAALATSGIVAEVHVCSGAQLTATARRVAGAGVDAVIAAGGDGTVSAVATALAGGSVPLAVLPLGTLNHFARDIGMPTDLALAASAIAAHRLEWIDVGEVNGRVFINNSSIGLYPAMIRTRDEQRRRGWRKWPAMVVAAGRVLRRFPMLRVHVETPASVVVAATPFIFVGNNPYTINMLELGQRPRLDRGELSLVMMRCRGRAHMVWLTLRSIVQRLDAVPDVAAEAVTEVRVGVGRARRLEVAVDGEVVTMTSPLHYRIRPGVLPVLFAPAAAAVEPSHANRTSA